MKTLYRRFLTVILLLGTILILLQIFLAFGSTFLSLDKMLTTTSTSLLASTNREITMNINERFERMMKIGNLIANNDSFRTFSRTESKLPMEEKVATELTLGQTISSLTAIDTFCDCGLVFNDGTTLGQLDARTLDQFEGKELYTYFSDLSDRDSENFRIGKDNDSSRLYYSKSVNSSTIILVSILREELDPIFYDAEENFNLTLHMSTQDQSIIYSGDEVENSSGKLDDNLAQAVESSDHLSIQLRGNVIASDACLNGWRITSTIPEDTLTAENSNLKSIYLIMSIGISVLGIIIIIILCLQVKKRMKLFQEIEENLDDITDIKDLKINR